MLTSDQLMAREGKMFSTDAPAALGLSKYRSPIDVWNEKRGEPVEQTEQSPAAHWGLMMQPVIAREYSDRTGIRLREANYTKFHPEHPWMGSHFDYIADDTRGVEIKNFHAMRRHEFGDEGTDQVPMEVLIQCLHEAVVHGWQIVDVAVLFGGQDFGIWSVPNDPETAERLIQQELDFMARVTSGIPPEPRTADEARALWPVSQSIVIQASAMTAKACEDLSALKEQIKQMEDLVGAKTAAIQSALGSADTLMHGEKILATWKSAKESKYFDKDRFAKEMPEVLEAYTSTRPGSRRFLLK